MERSPQNGAMDFLESLLTVGIAGFVLLVGLIVGLVVYRRGWNIPRPDEALIIMGRDRRGRRQVHAEDIDSDAAQAIKEERIEGTEFDIRTSACWVNPVTKRVYRLALDSRSTDFEVTCHDLQKIEVKVKGVVLFKVGDNWPAMRAAARRFMSMDEGALNQNIRDLVTGQVRALVGTMTIPELITERQTLIDKVRDTTKDDMAKLGLSIDSLTIQELWDDHGYIENLGRPQREEVERAASIAADQARREKERAKQAADLDVAQAQRDTEIERAKFQAEQDRERETASQSGPLARAEAERAVVQQQTEVAQLQVAMEEKRLDAEVRKRAEASRYAAEQEAEAEKARRLREAEAEAEAARAIGEARAAAARAEGEAEAAVIRARGMAEAEAIAARADALAENGDRLIEQDVVKQLPEVARAVAEPFGRIDSMVVLDGPDGVSKGIIGAVTAVGNAVGQIRGLDGNGNGGGNGGKRPAPATPEAAAAGPAPSASSRVAAPAAKVREAVGDAGARLSDLLNEVADQGDDLDSALQRIDADDELREVARGLAKHPDRSRLLDELGLTDRGVIAGNMLFDVLSRDE